MAGIMKFFKPTDGGGGSARKPLSDKGCNIAKGPSTLDTPRPSGPCNRVADDADLDVVVVSEQVGATRGFGRARHERRCLFERVPATAWRLMEDAFPVLLICAETNYV